MFHVLTSSGTIEGVRHNPDALTPAYGSSDPKRTYPRLRKEGYPALGAWNLSKLLARADAECEAERLVFATVPDEGADLSWLDQTDEQMGRGFQASAKVERERANLDGVWGLVAYIRASEAHKWEEADSLWGFIGDDVLAPHAFEQVAAEAMAELDKLLASVCPTCGRSGAH